MSDPSFTRAHLDSRALQVLAHPLRSRILTRLRRDGPATATTLASALTTNTGATSYHLRKLADVELVAETGGGSARERWWKATTEAHGWTAADVDGDPDGEAASLWLSRHYFEQFAEEYRQWLDQSEQWPLAWRTAANSSDQSLSLSPPQLESLAAEVIALVRSYAEPDPDESADVRRVRVQFHAFPLDRE